MNGDALVKKTTKIMFGDAGISGTAQYMSQLVWVLFLKVFDYKEEEWELEGDYMPVIPAPFRFRDWADPRNEDGSKDYSNRMTGDKLIGFVNNSLFPYLSGKEIEFDGKKILFSSDDNKAKIIRSFMAESQNYMKDGVRLRQLINEIGDIDFDVSSQKHDFNDFYERLLKELQNGGKATGEFYTPRAITQFIVDHVDPIIGEKVADFACGTGGFLADAVSHLQKQAKSVDDAIKIQKSVYGIEWKQLPYMLCVTNMYLHNLDDPSIVHGDGLAKNVLDLSDDDLFDCVIMNPPFGGEFNKADLNNFPDNIASSESADLFVARIIYCLKKNGRCGLVLPDGLLFNSDPSKVNLKKLLLNECNLHTVIRLPGSVFAPYTSISTNLLFFEKSGKTKSVWFYRMDMPDGVKHFNKTHPITRNDLKVVDEWWNNRHEIKDEKEDPSSSESWKAREYSYDEIEKMGFNLDLCGYPHEEEEVLNPFETVQIFKERLNSTFTEISKTTTDIESLLVGGDADAAFNNLISECMHLSEITNDLPGNLRKSILQYAMQGKLTKQLESEGSAYDLLPELCIDDKLKVTDIPYDIPETWMWLPIGSLGETTGTDSFSDGPFGSNLKTVHYISEPEVRIIQLSNIGENGWKDKNVKYTSYKHLEEEIPRCEVHPGDFVIAKMMPAGRTIIVPDLGTRITLGSDAMKFVPNKALDKEYLLYAMHSQVFLDQVYAKAHGITRVRTTLKGIKSYVLPIPPVKEQVRIVKRLKEILVRIDGGLEEA
ncbi:N-6 DNA methylase [Butyrivibrio sp. WCD3002]|uniref:N-6 DNA methylase n=1 Tax=Butyrivibrio sp. WCD3002 TaxID=1280676 RepID=UPI0004181D49|nr:N-6 DNA methylase [Butyrivibrio sp. WCD3002]